MGSGSSRVSSSNRSVPPLRSALKRSRSRVHFSNTNSRNNSEPDINESIPMIRSRASNPQQTRTLDKTHNGIFSRYYKKYQQITENRTKRLKNNPSFMAKATGKMAKNFNLKKIGYAGAQALAKGAKVVGQASYTGAKALGQAAYHTPGAIRSFGSKTYKASQAAKNTMVAYTNYLRGRGKHSKEFNNALETYKAAATKRQMATTNEDIEAADNDLNKAAENIHMVYLKLRGQGFKNIDKNIVNKMDKIDASLNLQKRWANNFKAKQSGSVNLQQKWANNLRAKTNALTERTLRRTYTTTTINSRTANNSNNNNNNNNNTAT